VGGVRNEDLELKVRYLEESLKDVQKWQHRHTKTFCCDCRKEGVYKIRTIDGFTLYACDHHVDAWVGCSCNGRIIGS
jgi:hypothetical protein